jgi:hypothetical protein
MARGLRWGVAATVQASPAQVAAFAAHHLDLGAHRVWLHFDDPDDPAADAFAGQDRVTVIRCDAAYWDELCGKRPDTHQERQVRNITRILRKARVDWIAHVDVDEFLQAAVPVAEALADVDPDRVLLRVEPWEALHDPALPDDVFTGRAFRRQVPEDAKALVKLLYGRFGTALDRGMLSHSAGKCFFRTGIREMVARIHSARIRGEPVFGGRFHPDLALLHFHAQDPEHWKARLPFRLAMGAYRAKPELQALLAGADAAMVDAFYTMIQSARPDLLRELSAHGLLREADLGLRARVAARFPGLA